jgi:hypothetical protein
MLVVGEPAQSPHPQPTELNAEVVGERPRANLMEAPRTVPLPVALAGITVTGLRRDADGLIVIAITITD